MRDTTVVCDDAALEAILRRLDSNPWDADARFDLGVTLTLRGHAEHGSRHLDRAFRQAPQGILRLLAEPQLEPVRTRPEVVTVLRRHHREHSRRAYLSYA